jgi:hypothetical protein
MTEIKVEDVLIPLLKNHYDELRFNQKFDGIRNNPKPLYLKDDFGFSINFIHIITSNELNGILNSLNDSKVFEHIKENENDYIDNLFLNEIGIDLFNRNIFKYNKKIEIENCNHTSEKFRYELFVNIAEIKYGKYNKIPYHIISLILTSFNHNENSNLCNKQIINLVNVEISVSFSSLNDLPENIKNLLKKDTFVAIQLWNHRWESEKDNTFDAKTYVEENPYFFYSILTLEEKIFRRSYDNIMDVLGWCQSASSAYFDVFYGTTCLELTIKPKIEIFDEIGHDSEEFRIWELFALQKKLLDKIHEKEMNNVDDLIKELDLIYNFKIFTKKTGKGENWIRYGEYLQKITGIDSAYQDYKIENEKIKNREQQSKLQKLNSLIIVSILASFLTLLLSPIYSSWVPTSLYFENIVKNPYREIKAIHLALILTYGSYLCVYRLKDANIFEYIYKLTYKNYSIYIKYLRIIFVIFVISFIISFFGY